MKYLYKCSEKHFAKNDAPITAYLGVGVVWGVGRQFFIFISKTFLNQVLQVDSIYVSHTTSLCSQKYSEQQHHNIT